VLPGAQFPSAQAHRRLADGHDAESRTASDGDLYGHRFPHQDPATNFGAASGASSRGRQAHMRRGSDVKALLDLELKKTTRLARELRKAGFL
jgi:hypothetical protein